ncbi:family 2B encapsulin nanocompartment shell protein [Kitasatospora sp. MAP5-34]|uniref:family 2B encapsulin nanocompartment shell protein n=1 Tax=Kitasatospora sp. MAP5-34 TaxID=3035102 RepID=UPI0024742C3C|nr:family 2B encapsulin nanocompartment shell protein [Kitasatospora sp. MAP5-34]MDH6575893.1 CRP-like cAMP-binding protein [Kitasatospora sp. MAP5-34]
MTVEADTGPAQEKSQFSLSTAAARNLATTTKSAPQMRGISSRWLLRRLPWVEVSGGTYRVNRRLSLAVGRGRVGFVQSGADNVRIIPETLREIPVLRGFDDDDLLTELAGRFTLREFRSGDVLVEEGHPIEEVFIVAHGRIERLATGKYGVQETLGVLSDGDHLGDEALLQSDPLWMATVRATTAGTILALPWDSFLELFHRSEKLRQHISAFLANASRKVNSKGEVEVAVSAGHEGEADIPGSFVDYDLAPREYELSITQTILRVHSRVADLYNDPMNQVEEQLKLTVEEIRERQEWELLNNRDFGLLHNVDYDQRINTWSGPPTPDDLDDLLAMRRGTDMFLAHPKAIAAFFRECNRRGIYPDSTEVDGHRIPAWRNVPIFPCSKIPVTDGQMSSILAMRTGEDRQGVIGLRQTGIPDEYEPSLNVRFMGIDDQALIKYLVTAYASVAILVGDAVGILENVHVAAPRS